MTGILLINLGSPDKPDYRSVRRFISEFLFDPYVLDINPVARKFLAHFIIAPFRSLRSAKAYQKIWMPEGAPLIVHTRRLAEKVSLVLGRDFLVTHAMRYGKPSICGVLSDFMDLGLDQLIVLPLYPQYAFSSTKTAVEEVRKYMKESDLKVPIKILPPFFDHPAYLGSIAKMGRPVLDDKHPDHVLFSFHGLPERHIEKGDPYKDQCHATARLLATELGLKEGDCSVSFQSRLGRMPWIKPYTNLVLADLPRSGKKRVVVFCPSFTADCLETLEEIGMRGRESFIANGGEELELVPSLNDNPSWVEAVCGMVKSSIHAQNPQAP